MTEPTNTPVAPMPGQNPQVDIEGERETNIRDVEKGTFGLFFAAIAVALSAFHIFANLAGTISTLWMVGVHFAGFAFLCALRHPAIVTQNARSQKWVLAFDMAFGGLVAGATLWLIGSENAIYARGVHLSPVEWILAGIVVLGALEFCRRTTGWIIPVLIVIALTYPTSWGTWIGGIFRFAGLSVETVTFRTIFSDEGMFGSIAYISATFVFLFILFGAFLVRSGAGDFIIDLARAVAGRVAGGPGFVAVFASGLTGTISGSAVANTVSTGVITIPLMKRSGFPAKFAAGVEAASSTGGQLMPPIMGAGAFVMANYTQIPYLTIAAVSILPAIIYFLSVAFYVRIEAKKHNLVGIDGESPKVMDVLKRGGPAFLIPIATLIGLLIYGFTPVYSASWAIASVIFASWLTPNRMGPRAIFEALVMGAKNMIMTGILLVSVGAIVNVIAMTGIGNTFSLMIAQWSGGNLLIALTLIALASLVLGMGLPVTAAYIVLATLSAPALHILIENGHLASMLAAGTVPVETGAIFALADPSILMKLGAPMPLSEAQALIESMPPEILSLIYPQVLDPAVISAALLSAHMIIFWLSQDSNVTPPVCLTAFAAAAIAKSPHMATGVTAWKLAKGLYIVPILFAYTNFIGGTPFEVFTVFIVALIGTYALGATIEGHMETPLSWPLRIVTGLSGIALLWPNTPYLEIAGGAIILAILAWSIRQDRRRQALA